MSIRDQAPGTSIHHHRPGPSIWLYHISDINVGLLTYTRMLQERQFDIRVPKVPNTGTSAVYLGSAVRNPFELVLRCTLTRAG